MKEIINTNQETPYDIKKGIEDLLNDEDRLVKHVDDAYKEIKDNRLADKRDNLFIGSQEVIERVLEKILNKKCEWVEIQKNIKFIEKLKNINFEEKIGEIMAKKRKSSHVKRDSKVFSTTQIKKMSDSSRKQILRDMKRTGIEEPSEEDVGKHGFSD